MDSIVLPLPFDASKLAGLSQRLLESHHSNNYAGAVKRLNAIRTQLRQLDFAGAPGFQLNGLKREELVAANSMLLHEVYFDSLGGDGHTMTPAMELALLRISAALRAGARNSPRWARRSAAARAGSS